MAYIPSGRFGGPARDTGEVRTMHCQKVLDVINDYFDTTTDMLIKKCRKREIVWPRQVAMYFMAYFTQMPLKGIGIIFNKDHTTVIHAVQVVNDLQQSDILVKDQITLLTQKLEEYASVERQNKRLGEGQYPGHA